MEMINNIVGSANAKFERDFHSQTKTKRQHPLSSRLASFLFKTSACQQLTNERDPPDFDFKLVKISCRKQPEYDSQTVFSAKLKGILESILLVLFCLLLIFSILIIFGLNGDGESLLRTRRSVNIYSSDVIEEWSSQNIPSIYEVDLMHLLGTDLSSIDEVHDKLSYIKNTLKFNCIQVKNVNGAFDITFKDFFAVSSNDQVYQKEMKRLEALKYLLKISHEMLLRVIFEIDFEVGTLTSNPLFTNSQNTDIFMTQNTTGTSSSVTQWKYSVILQTFYLTKKSNPNFAFFNINNINIQDAYVNMVKFWSSSLDSDGIYIKNFNQVMHDNSSHVHGFIAKLKSQIPAIPVFTFIGDFSNDRTINQLYQIYRVGLDAENLFTNLRDASFKRNQLDTYLNAGKKIIWSLISSKEKDPSILRNLFLSYSLPGFTLIRKNEELDSSERSVASFIKLFNGVIKPKLNDYKPEKPVTTPAPIFTTPNPRPEPFKDPAYTSLTDAYLSEYTNYDVSVQFGSVLKVTRQIDNYQDMHRHRQHFFSTKFYRNVIFLVNLSEFNIPIDQIIRLPRTFTRAYLNRSPFHVLYDSSQALPGFLMVDSRNQMHEYYLLKNHTLAIEF